EARKSLAEHEAAIDAWTNEMVAGPVGSMPIAWSEFLLNLHWYREAKTLIAGSPPLEDPRLAAVRERALEVTQGDVFTYMEAGRKAVERRAWDAAPASYATAIDKLPLSVRPSPQRMGFFFEMIQQPEVFQRLVELRPDEYTLWWARGHSLASRRQWSQAASDLTHVLKLQGEG